MTDLYPESGWKFVCGQASLRDGVGVYRFARYDPRSYEAIGQMTMERPRATESLRYDVAEPAAETQ